MSKEERKVPELRFKGFHDDWEQRELWEEYKIIMGQSPNSQNYTSNSEDYILVQGNADILNGWVKPRVWTTQVTKMANKGAIILSVRAPVGEVGKTQYPIVLGRGVAGIEGDEFVFQLLIKMKNDFVWRRLSTGSTFDSINSKDLKSIRIFTPKKPEKELIGEYLEKLDHIVNLHQRKINTLETFKKVYLSVMFTNKNDNTPLLRFKNFTEAWEQRELSQISNKVKEKNKDTIYTETLTNSAEYGIVPQTDYFDKEISNSKNISGYYIVRPNDFVYNPRISNFAPVGPIKRNKLSTIGIMSPLYYIFRPENIINDFLEKYFASNHWHRFMKQNGDSGARADRFAIKDKVFTEMPIPYPNIEEQKKVGIFLSNLDNVITLHQRKLYTLKKLKQAYLNKMFI